MQTFKKYKKPIYLKKSEDIEPYCTDFRNKPQEHLVLFHIGYNRRLYSREIIAIGTSRECYGCQREIMQSALKNKAEYLIAIHNHPEETYAVFSDNDFQNAWNLKFLTLFFNMKIAYFVITKKHIKKIDIRKKLKKKKYKKMIAETFKHIRKYVY